MQHTRVSALTGRNSHTHSISKSRPKFSPSCVTLSLHSTQLNASNCPISYSDADIFHPPNSSPPPCRSGAYFISLTANNGAGPVVVMDAIEVDEPITSLVLQYEPLDPAVGEGMIFIVTSNDDSRTMDVSFISKCFNTGLSSCT